ncbi:MAG: type II toxin-antitoxin system PemK/MazF family toxin [Acidobacteria bacterium]|nr:type II toxin-antitoxin system PemK/MazF family toxin [Acidobacteriota bacterium]
MTPEQRTIVLIPVPFSDFSSTKRRPVLVLSTTAHNLRSEDVLVAAITSKLTRQRNSIRITAADLEQGTLKRDSLVRADKIYTLSKSLLLKQFGKLSEAKFRRVLSALDKVLGR